MNFPSMPFDESMFAEGQTMNLYWDQELRNRSKYDFEPVAAKPEPEQPVEQAPVEPEQPEQPVPEDEEVIAEEVIVAESIDVVRRDGRVYTKSTATTVTLWVIVGVLAAFIIVMFYLRSTKKLRF